MNVTVPFEVISVTFKVTLIVLDDGFVLFSDES